MNECEVGCLPGDDGDLAWKTELLEGRCEGLVDAVLERNCLNLHVLNSGDDWLAVINLDIVLDTLALLIVDDVDRVLLGSLVHANSSGSECAEWGDGGRRAEARASAACGSDGGAEERHVGCMRLLDVGWRKIC